MKYENDLKKDQIVKFLREYAYFKTNVSVTLNDVKVLTPNIVKNNNNCGINDSKICFIYVVKDANFL